MTSRRGGRWLGVTSIGLDMDVLKTLLRRERTFGAISFIGRVRGETLVKFIIRLLILDAYATIPENIGNG